MILLLFFYDPLYASSHGLESDYPWSGFKNENYPTFQLVTANHEMIFYIYPVGRYWKIIFESKI